MCAIGEHRCMFCKTIYDCELPNRECPTFTGDEESDMCPGCIKRFGDDAQRWWDEHDYDES